MSKTRVETIDVLEAGKGYVRLIETWGNEERIIEAARMSTDKGFIGWGPLHATNCAQHPDFASTLRYMAPEQLPPVIPCTCDAKPGDEQLLGYLYNNWHHTPFEMAGMIIEVQAPIFVFREWHRHRTQSYNELSARYVELPEMFYYPSDVRLSMMQAKKNKQSSDVATISPEQLNERKQILELAYNEARQYYLRLIELGVPREVARIVIPVAQYSRMRVSANLRNWLAFLTLRMDPAAQWEIRCYAHAVAQLIAKHFVRTYQLFNNKRTEATVTIELFNACKALLDAPHYDHFATRLSDGEMSALDRIKAEVGRIDEKQKRIVQA